MNERYFRLWRWAPTTASITLLLLIVVVSVFTVSELRSATYWREHTFEVILDAQTLKDKLVDAQSDVDRYVEKGQSNLLIEYKNDTNIDMQELNAIAELTRDNAGQQQRLKVLAAAVQALFAYDNNVVGIYARQGSAAAERVNIADEGKDMMDHAISDLQNFTDEEKQLLIKRDATEQRDYHRAARMLIIGSILVAGLLILANYIASREMARRRRAETEQHELIDKLQGALAEVKTLSGLIPICGWCKNVRSDTGFWQSVEQYVHSRTDATFTHGVCPACAEKFKADVVKANSSSATQ